MQVALLCLVLAAYLASPVRAEPPFFHIYSYSDPNAEEVERGNTRVAVRREQAEMQQQDIANYGQQVQQESMPSMPAHPPTPPAQRHNAMLPPPPHAELDNSGYAPSRRRKAHRRPPLTAAAPRCRPQQA